MLLGRPAVKLVSATEIVIGGLIPYCIASPVARYCADNYSKTTIGHLVHRKVNTQIVGENTALESRTKTETLVRFQCLVR